MEIFNNALGITNRVASADIKMEDLLQAQFEDRASLSLFNGLAKFSLSHLLYQINKKYVSFQCCPTVTVSPPPRFYVWLISIAALRYISRPLTIFKLCCFLSLQVRYSWHAHVPLSQQVFVLWFWSASAMTEIVIQLHVCSLSGLNTSSASFTAWSGS